MAKKKTRSTVSRIESPRKPEVEGAAKTTSLSTEYHYVIRDLTQIAIIAIVLIAGLVALSFFI